MFRNIETCWKVVVAVYNMEDFAKECVRVFCELTGYDRTRVGTAPIPFFMNLKTHSPSSRATSLNLDRLENRLRGGESSHGGR